MEGQLRKQVGVGNQRQEGGQGWGQSSMEGGRLAVGEGKGMEQGMLVEQAQEEEQPAGEQRDGLLFLCMTLRK